MNLEWFDDEDKLIDILKERPFSSRKTYYSALLCVSKNTDKYKKHLLEDAVEYNKMIKGQTKSKTQEENWKSFDEIKKIYESNYNKIKPLLNSKEELSKKDFVSLQDFIVLSLTSGYWIPPRRSQDWCEFKIRNYDPNEDNCINKGHLVFNKYKTSKFYHGQTVAIPKGLKLILTKWIKLNTSDYLIVDHYGNKMTSVKLTQRLNRIFDGLKISTSMLRHIYLTERLKDVPKLLELEQLATDMGHSPMQALEYVKH
jgi:hypothetical protein